MAQQTDSMKDLLEKDLLGQVHSAVEYFNKVSDFNKSQPAVKVKQTAVEWLVDKVTDMIHESNHLELVSLLEQAKEMEKEQIVDAANLPKDKRWYNSEKYNNCGEQYYNETYNK